MKIIVMCILIAFAGLQGMGSAEIKSVSSRSVSSPSIICIDPGHQQKGMSQTEAIAPGSKTKKAKVTTGATGVKTKITESSLALDVSLLLEKELIQEGYSVTMTRNKQDIQISNQERAKVCNKAKSSIAIRIHADSHENSKTKGFSILVPDHAVSQKNKIVTSSNSFAKLLESSYQKQTPFVSRGIHKRSDLTGFNWSTVPTVVLEMGFLSNSKEDQLLNNKETQKQIVQAVVDAVRAFVNSSK